MHLILLSGGSGTRLWPLSNGVRSKQFLKVLKREDGQLESMVQRVWGQLTSVKLAENSIIATSKSQVDMIQNQLGGKVKCVIEPERRDTFPAIALAAAYLFSVDKVDLEEVVAVQPVDPFVRDHFFHKVKELEDVLLNSEAHLALIGVNPTFPSSKYGYIIPKQDKFDKFYLDVDHFLEKPAEKEAAELINKGALWNCGVFGFRLRYLIDLLKQKNLPVDYEELLVQYAKIPKISFDYEVVEKEKKIVVLPYDGEWKDLGTWNTLTEEMSDSLVGKGLISEDSHNVHLINELDIPLTVLGLSNAVVVASPDGILVADKAQSPRVKEIAGAFEQRPMFEERRWGWYRVLDYDETVGSEVLTKRIGIEAGKSLSYQMHANRSEVWTIIRGEGEIALNNKIYPVKPGDVFNIPAGMKHAIKGNTPLEFIEVQYGEGLIEEDIMRIFMTWDEVEGHCSKEKMYQKIGSNVFG